jgi:predicted DNA-binding transcriptional regulator AlpA
MQFARQPHLRTRAGLPTRSLLSISEVALIIGEERSTLYRSIKRGDFPLPVVTINGRMRVARRALERLLDGSSDSPTATDQSADRASYEGSSASRSRPMCTAARRSSSPIASV